jgi:FkbM family methyltransferase
MPLLVPLAAAVSQRLGRESRIIRALRPSYELLLDIASGGRGVEWLVNDEILRIDPRARRLIPSTTEPDLWAWLRCHVRPGEHVLDVGSFLGVYAVAIARWAGPSGRLLAFEPTSAAHRLLQRHVRLNGVQGQVRTFPLALGEHESNAELHEHSDPYRNAVGMTDPGGVGTRISTVQMSTIDEICRRESFSPTLLRMDVQGFELAILRGARETVARSRGRLRIVLEVHPQLWPLLGFGTEDFERTLSELGLRARTLDGHSAPPYEPDGHVELEYLR